jgi:DNA polymerase-4
LPDPVDSGLVIARSAKALAATLDPSPGVRLLGVSVSGLTDQPTQQLSFTDAADPAWSDVDQTVDRIRERFGSAAIGPAALVGHDGLRIKRRGDQQWGPGGGGEPDTGE